MRRAIVLSAAVGSATPVVGVYWCGSRSVGSMAPLDHLYVLAVAMLDACWPPPLPLGCPAETGVSSTPVLVSQLRYRSLATEREKDLIRSGRASLAGLYLILTHPIPSCLHV